MSGNNNSNSTSNFNENKKRAGRRPRCMTLATTLDLHGYRKGGAMSQLTSFLEGHRVAGTTASVQVITGTGSHSSDIGGPVLRSAVQSLLKRREMEFSRNTAGSFLVNAQSGVTWFSKQSTSEDTKVLLRDGNDEDIRIQQAAAKTARKRQQKQHQYMRQSSAPIMSMSTGIHLSIGAFDNTRSGSNSPLLDPGPSLTEVARSEAEWNNAKDESVELARHHHKQNTKEEREFRRVMSASEEELKKEEEKEKEIFDQAVALSKRGELLERRDDERLLQNALAESQREETLARETLAVNEQELEQAFQDALTMSLADAAAGASDSREQDEEELEQAFQDALTRSLAAGDTDPREQDEDERMMQLALELSLQ